MDRGAWWATVHSVAKKWLNTHAPKSSVRFQRSKVHPTRVPPPQMPIASPGCYLCFWQTGFKLKVPTTPSLGLTDLLEWIRSQSSSRSFGNVSDSLRPRAPVRRNWSRVGSLRAGSASTFPDSNRGSNLENRGFLFLILTVTGLILQLNKAGTVENCRQDTGECIALNSDHRERCCERGAEGWDRQPAGKERDLAWWGSWSPLKTLPKQNKWCECVCVFWVGNKICLEKDLDFGL